MSGTASAGLADDQADAVLEAIAKTLRIVLTSTQTVQPGQRVTASLVPASPEIDASDLANGVLNLAMTSKDLLFGGTSVLDVPESGDLQGDTLASTVSVFGNQPFPPPTPVLNGGQTTNPSGALAQIFGTAGLPNLKVQCEIGWIVRDQAGTRLIEGQDFIVEQGLGSPQFWVRLPPAFRELRLDTIEKPGGEIRCLSAEVTLRLGSRARGPFEVGPVPVIVLPLLIPTIVALFSEPSFGVTHDSAALIVVPKHSPFANLEPLFKTLRKIESAVDALRGIGGVATFLLGLDDLVDAVPEQPRLRFAAEDEIPELGRYVIKRRPWYAFLSDDTTFDDRVYSLLVFGIPGTRVEFYNDEFFKRAPATRQGTFTLDLGLECFAAIRTLDTDSRTNAPITFPPSRVDPSNFEPDTSSANDGVWHTDMSSLRFDQMWLRIAEQEAQNPLERPPLLCQPPVELEPKRPSRAKRRSRAS
jgi:hypothetical protein